MIEAQTISLAGVQQKARSNWQEWMSLEVGIPKPGITHSQEMIAWLGKARLWKCFVTAKGRPAASRNGTSIENQISAWVTRQRRDFKSGALSSEKLKILSDADFEWSVDFDERWNECFALLQVYVQEKGVWPRLRGDTLLEMRLAGWVSGQCAAIRSGAIRQDRLKKLQSSSFWKTPDGVPKWNKNFEKWIAFTARTKRVPLYDAKDDAERSLYRWAYLQRNQHKKGLLSMERMQHLSAVHFPWV